MIPRYFIDDLIAATDITSLIKSRLTLKKQGKSFVALCPFHNEKSPSFNVIPEKRFYYCHGCGAHGNAIGFLMQYDRMEFVEAVQALAAELGMQVPEQDKPEKSDNHDDLELLEKVDHYYQSCLKQSKEAIAYLKSRGLNGQIAKQFHLGFAPNQWDSLLKKLGETHVAGLKRQGLIIEKDKARCYDRFRHRIIFPICNTNGHTIAFGGRTLGDDTPKYLNSPETPLFHKSHELYGLYQVLQHSHSPESVLVVEGYMDVIALHQYGVCNAVATLGTATNAKHLQKLFRYTACVIFCFDGDTAGRQAAWRALTNNLSSMRDGIQIRFMFLPHNEDPDSLVRRIGQAGFLQRMEHAAPLSQVFFDLLAEENPINTPDEKAQFANQAKNYLNRIPAGIFKELMLSELGKRINVYVDTLEKSSTTTQDKPLLKNRHNLLDPAQKALALLLQKPQLHREFIDASTLGELNNPHVTLLSTVIELLQQNPALSIGEMMSHLTEETQQQQLAMLAARQLPFSDEGILMEFKGAMGALKKRYREQEIERLITQSKQQPLTSDDRIKLSQLLTDNQGKQV